MNNSLPHTHILIVEDNDGDVLLIRESFEAASFEHTLHFVTDGEAALDFLYKKGAYEQAVTPNLILLDLNLPRKTGYDVLQDIKSHESLRLIPICVLSSSKNDEDVIKSYGLRANCYLTKPTTAKGFENMIAQLEQFWMHAAQLPKIQTQNTGT